MRKFLVNVDRNLESSYALRTACLFGDAILIKPIHAVDPPDRDMTFGAGWARVSYEREASKMALKSIEGLVLAEKYQHPNIESAVMIAGDPVSETADYYWQGNFDLLFVGTSYRGFHPLTLVKKFRHAALKENKEISLLIVHNLTSITKIVALTDGGDMAEKALGRLVQIGSILNPEITLVGLPKEGKSSGTTDVMALERGMAILKEKGFNPTGYTASTLGQEGLIKHMEISDLAVSPFLTDAKRYKNLIEFFDDGFRSVLFYLGKDHD